MESEAEIAAALARYREHRLEELAGYPDRLSEHDAERVARDLERWLEAEQARRQREADLAWARGWRRWVSTGAGAAGVAVAFAAIALWMAFRSVPVASPSGAEPLVGLVERLVAAGHTPSPAFDSGAASLAVVLVTIALLLAVAKLFGTSDGARPRNDDDGVTRIIAAAIGTIGGVFALSKIGAPVLPESWGMVAGQATLATLVCVGLAVARSDDRCMSRLGTAVVGVCLVGLIAPLLGCGETETDGFPPTTTLVPTTTSTVTSTSPPPGATTTTAPPPRAAAGVSVRQVARVRGFSSGVASPDEAASCAPVAEADRAAFRRSIEAAARKLRRILAHGHDVRLLLVPSVDRDRLVDACLTRFGTNQRLARARARRVAEALASASAGAPYAIVTTGPLDCGIADRSQDRFVRVFAVFSRQPRLASVMAR
ncbi:MAG: hypothetical protein KIT14_23175 [bacterium]|nr:hypothetical protein [bacterium]